MELFSFSGSVAKDVGVNAAVLFYNIAWWIEKNRVNNSNFHDGDYWTYNSMKAFGEMFPFLSKQNIRTALKSLIEKKYVKTGNYNAAGYDKTLWYALAETGKSVCENQQMQVLESTIASVETNTPIPDNYTDINTDISNNSVYVLCDKRERRFSPPTVEEVKAYCIERGNTVDPEKFVDFYTAKGWKVGKTPMRDWKAAVRTWEKHDGKTNSVYRFDPGSEEDYL